jgi:hypothetical protein
MSYTNLNIKQFEKRNASYSLISTLGNNGGAQLKEVGV